MFIGTQPHSFVHTSFLVLITKTALCTHFQNVMASKLGGKLSGSLQRSFPTPLLEDEAPGMSGYIVFRKWVHRRLLRKWVWGLVGVNLLHTMTWLVGNLNLSWLSSLTIIKWRLIWRVCVVNDSFILDLSHSLLPAPEILIHLLKHAYTYTSAHIYSLRQRTLTVSGLIIHSCLPLCSVSASSIQSSYPIALGWAGRWETYPECEGAMQGLWLALSEQVKNTYIQEQLWRSGLV